MGLPTQADFASRMNATKGTGGQHFWATDEGVGALDTAHASGTHKFTTTRDAEKLTWDIFWALKMVLPTVLSA